MGRFHRHSDGTTHDHDHEDAPLGSFDPAHDHNGADHDHDHSHDHSRRARGEGRGRPQRLRPDGAVAGGGAGGHPGRERPGGGGERAGPGQGGSPGGQPHVVTGGGQDLPAQAHPRGPEPDGAHGHPGGRHRHQHRRRPARGLRGRRRPRQHQQRLRRRVSPRRGDGAFRPAPPAPRRHRPAGHRERRQPGLPGRVQGRRARGGDGLRRHRGRGEAAQVPGDVPGGRRGGGQQGRPAPVPRLRPRQVL